MNLKTYQAYSVNEVLQQIRNDLGEDAAILHTRTFKRGGILGLFAKTVIEVTVADSKTGKPRIISNNPKTKLTDNPQTSTKKIPPAKNSASITRIAYSLSGKNTVNHIPNTKSQVAEIENNSIKPVHENPAGNIPQSIRPNKNNQKTPPHTNRFIRNKTRENPLNPKLVDLCQLIQKNRNAANNKNVTSEPAIISKEHLTNNNNNNNKKNAEKPAKPDIPVARRFILTQNKNSDVHNLKQAKPPEKSRQSSDDRITENTNHDPVYTRDNLVTSSKSPTHTASRIIKNNNKPVIVTNDNINLNSTPTTDSLTENTAQSSSDNALTPISDEISVVKQMVAQVLQKQAGTYQPAMPRELSKFYMTLIENEIAQDLADEICGKVRDELNTSQFNDAQLVKTQILKHLKEYIPEAKNPAATTKTDDGRPLTLALIGPTGVGKTTTLAKLAATFKLKHNKRVGLITTDTYRIAAVDQLRTYANIIGLPLKVALTPEEIAAACHSFRNFDVILIDTAGRSPNDKTKIDEIQNFLLAASPHETHLVLASTYSETVMLKTADKFAEVQIDRIIFTKLDEAVSFGVLVNVIRRIGKQISYITTGQEVPDHIEAGTSDRLAKLAIGEIDI